jgi:head-tail adaptor
MIAAGKLNKTIQIQKLERFKDEYFADVEQWVDVFTAR